MEAFFIIDMFDFYRGYELVILHMIFILICDTVNGLLFVCFT